MLDICLLGTGGTQPLINRWLTSLMVRYKGHAILIDCGEGTQIAAQKAGLSLKPVDKILITHLHADHFVADHVAQIAAGKQQPLRLNAR